MVNFPSKNQLSQLESFNNPYCLTLYVPFIDPNAATNPNRIEYKNLLKQAEIALHGAGASQTHIRKTLGPARSLLENGEFWPIHYESLALFMHLKLFHYYHIPDHNTPYLLTVGKGFNLDPLVKAMRDDCTYYVLALSHNNVKLFEGGHYRIRALHLGHFPANMKEALNIDEYPKWQEKHMVAPASSGRGAEAVHGQYNVSQTDKTMLAEFFRLIDRRLHPLLMKHRAPLILAGTKYLLPIYRRVNTYPQLITQGIAGNVEHVRPEVIRKQAWSLIREGGMI